MHNLLHIVDCAIKFGNLDNFSCFPFENYLQKLIKSLRKSEKPLQQIVKRITESSFVYNISREDTEIDSKIIYSKLHLEGPLLNRCTNPQYKKVTMGRLVVSCDSLANRFVELEDGSIMEITNFCFCEEDFVMLGYFVEKINEELSSDHTHTDLKSSDLNINCISLNQTVLKCVLFKKAVKKLLVLKYNERENLYVSFPLLTFPQH